MITRFAPWKANSALRAEIAALKRQLDTEREAVTHRLLDVQQEWLAIARQQQEALDNTQASQDMLRRIEERLDSLDRANTEAKDIITRVEQEAGKQRELGERSRERLEVSFTKLEKRAQRQAEEAGRTMLALAERISTIAR